MEDADNAVCRRKLLIDFLLVIALIIPMIICEIVIKPKQRGFFCNDETLQYPYQPSSISGGVLLLVSVLLPLLLIIIVELVRFFHAIKSGRKLQPLLQWRITALVLECSKHFGFYMIGLILTFDTAEVAKFTIGRLRPHFMAVCQPQLPDGRTCSDLTLQGRYIDDYECIASGYTTKDVRQLRLSFPSHHAALCFYAMLYLTFYLQHRCNWRGSLLARHFLQFVLLMLAWFIALSRVADHWHHWSDVMTGSLMGVTVALLNAFCIAPISKKSTFKIAKHTRQQGQEEQLEQTDACIKEQEGKTTLPSYIHK